jgi:microcystin-dependent protein
LRCKSKAQTFLINKKPYLTMDPYIGQLMLFAGNFAPRGWAFCDGQLLSIAQNSALFSVLGTTYGGNGETTFGVPDLRGRAPIGMGHGPGLPNITQGQQGGAAAVTLTTAQMPAHSHPVTLAGAQANINTTVTATLSGATASGNFPATPLTVKGEVAIPVNKIGGPFINSSKPAEAIMVNLPDTPATKIYSTGAGNGIYSGKAIPVTKGETTIPQTPLNLPVSGSVNIPIQMTAPVTGTASTTSVGSNLPVSIMSPYLGMNYCIAVEGIYPSRP